MSIAASAENAREGEHAHERDDVGGGREGQVGGEHRHDPRGEPHAAEQDVGRRAKQGGGVVRHHGVLVEQFRQREVRQQDRRRGAILQPGAALVHPAHEERRGEHHEQRLQDLECHPSREVHRTNTNNAISVRKL
jgi:hypothetical protein